MPLILGVSIGLVSAVILLILSWLLVRRGGLSACFSQRIHRRVGSGTITPSSILYDPAPAAATRSSTKWLLPHNPGLLTSDFLSVTTRTSTAVLSPHSSVADKPGRRSASSLEPVIIDIPGLRITATPSDDTEESSDSPPSYATDLEGNTRF
jgi:hypothetical protein